MSITIGVYKIRNVHNGKFYIGSSKHCEKRFIQHKYHLNRGSHHCSFLQSAWNKHGKTSFIFEIISVFENIEGALSFEQELLSKEFGTENCMNGSGYAVLPLNHKYSREKQKEAIKASEHYKSVHREVCLKRNADPEFKKKLKESINKSVKHKNAVINNAKTILQRPDVVEKTRKALRNSQKQKDAARKQAYKLTNDPEIRARNLLATSSKVVGTHIITGDKVFFPSQSAAAKYVGCYSSNISMCCSGQIKTVKEYIWQKA